ncbi:MAG: type VI secretion system tube protein Hcp [Planctomycetes bacterium]|nr:type VI secretion system tube protein Hcp [Planctomycetota bacterium]
MALHAFLTVPNIKGSARQKGREGKIAVVAFKHEVQSDRDEYGLPKKGPKHGALLVTKQFDLASPGLHGAHANNETFNEVRLEFWRLPPSGGGEENHLTIALGKARIASIRSFMDDVRKPEGSLLSEYEEVAFCYEQIAWSYQSGDGKDSASSTVVERVEEYWDEKFERIVGDAAQAVGKAVTDGLKEAVKGFTKDTATGK